MALVESKFVEATKDAVDPLIKIKLNEGNF